MGQKWKLVYYETDRGVSPIFEFIGSLEFKARTKVANTLDLLKEYGTKIGMPYAKKLAGADLWELRILGSDSIRIFYVAIVGKNFLLLHGFQKKKQKTDRREIKTAQERLKDYNSRSH